ncbi:MAG: ATP synthase F1 subunit epsilon [Armatimonadetes bacterium]|nr:ATP synthase F1 subunit epsilon [Armatimonadota bacterium]MDW8122939.1 ATP synthase F1 subunit epsilon [Armatimonadota bacterium]
MPATFSVEILTPERVLFSSDQVVSLTAPAWEGSLGVMARHLPMVAALQTGVITLRLADGGTIYIAVAGGFLEVAHNKAVILCDSAEIDKEIDVDRARQALERAVRQLQTFEKGIDREEVRRAKERAIARLKASGAL